MSKNNKNKLLDAIENKDIKAVKRLLWDDSDPNYLNDEGLTLLDITAMKGEEYLEIINLLLDYGANPNIEDKNKQTIIEKLIDAELYLKNGKSLPKSQSRHIDINSDYGLILKEIIYNSETNLNKLNSKGEPYFFEPILYNNLVITKLLTFYGADINAHDHENKNVIYKLMSQNTSFENENEKKRYINDLKVLLSLKADVNSRDSYGGTTVHKAILDNDIHTVKILLNAVNVDLDAVDNQGRNFIHNTMWKNKTEVFRFVYSKNRALLNKEDKYGVLPIHYAAFLGYADLVSELLDLGAHVNSRSKKSHYILKFLKRFHKNIDILIKNANTPDKLNKISTLIKHMKEEFGF